MCVFVWRSIYTKFTRYLLICWIYFHFFEVFSHCQNGGLAIAKALDISNLRSTRVKVLQIEALKLVNTRASILSKLVSFDKVRVKKGLNRVDSRSARLCYTKSHLRWGNLKYKYDTYIAFATLFFSDIHNPAKGQNERGPQYEFTS